MGFIKTLINKYHHKKIIRDYLKAFPPYEIHPSIGIDLQKYYNHLKKHARSQGKKPCELTEQEIHMFLEENYTTSKTGKVIRKYPLPDAPHPNLEKLKKEADETAARILERREEANQMAKTAKKEIRQTGKTNIRCPECGTAPVLSETENGERMYLSCKCGHIRDAEIYFCHKVPHPLSEEECQELRRQIDEQKMNCYN